jgi:hypothetical protein
VSPRTVQNIAVVIARIPATPEAGKLLERRIADRIGSCPTDRSRTSALPGDVLCCGYGTERSRRSAKQEENHRAHEKCQDGHQAPLRGVSDPSLRD